MLLPCRSVDYPKLAAQRLSSAAPARKEAAEGAGALPGVGCSACQAVPRGRFQNSTRRRAMPPTNKPDIKNASIRFSTPPNGR